MTRARRVQLVIENMPLAVKVARQVARKFSPRLDIEDFEQDGMLGLCEAAKRCTSVATFPRFAYFRVRGSMVDAHRRKAYREELNPSREGMAAAAGFGPELAGGLGAVCDGDDPAAALEEAASGIFPCATAMSHARVCFRSSTIGLHSSMFRRARRTHRTPSIATPLSCESVTTSVTGVV